MPKQQTSRDKGLTSPSESNLLIHYEDFELAQSVKRELMQLRSRPTIPTSEDVMLIAGRAAAHRFISSRWQNRCRQNQVGGVLGDLQTRSGD